MSRRTKDQDRSERCSHKLDCIGGTAAEVKQCTHCSTNYVCKPCTVASLDTAATADPAEYLCSSCASTEDIARHWKIKKSTAKKPGQAKKKLKLKAAETESQVEAAEARIFISPWPPSTATAAIEQEAEAMKEAAAAAVAAAADAEAKKEAASVAAAADAEAKKAQAAAEGTKLAVLLKQWLLVNTNLRTSSFAYAKEVRIRLPSVGNPTITANVPTNESNII